MTPNLPEIQITRKLRATRLRLRVEPTQIKLTVPQFCTQRQVQDFLKQSEQWMIETWQKQQEKAGLQDRSLPIKLKLFNLEQPLMVVYQTQKHSFILDDESHQLFISDRQPEQYLKSFVIAYAKEYLPIYLKQVSSETGLKYGDCSIRQPKTRWGSCSARHDIMLNSALVLFPEQVVRYVAVHELAHTKHFDHSPNFWAEVQKHDINFQQHRKILKMTAMPWWWVL
ncbi:MULTISPECIES: SprT family zinc-dependent metalloprotease [unclassified Acinetobacter]|uniref:YgjP family zinc-dependent metalloprotease n=1 Tax=unclassified Acinetobacter TaxID=196816 RepID=UPI0015D4411B|nr:MULTISPECIES: SprT family zinc-dependent metalloprotease [unclassified Acinetobacter]UUS59481.1 M48 family metallopeptidase [Acinetobacter sp. YH16056_T]